MIYRSIIFLFFGFVSLAVITLCEAEFSIFEFRIG